jgi:ribosome biogenesis GTPase
MTDRITPAERLGQLGWDLEFDSQFAQHAADGLLPARVVGGHRGAVAVDAGAGPQAAALGPALSRADPPGVGDWVAVRPPADGDERVVEAVLPRRTALVRRAAGDAQQAQVVAANVDVVLIAVPLDGGPNLRRLERELAVAWTSGAEPVVVLTKADLSDSLDEDLAAVDGVAFGVAALPVDALTGAGVDAVAERLAPRRTGVLLGPSGAGKSTLANRLLGVELLETAAVRADGRGRHTTTRRELLLVPSGGVLIDTPGVRSLGLWDAEEGVAATFADVEELAASCRFSDCEHETEPGCAVRAAIAAGTLDAARLESYRKLRRELQWQANRQDARARADERRRWRTINKEMRAGRPW